MMKKGDANVVASLSLEQQLEYWRKGSASLRQQMQPASNKNTQAA